MSNHEVSSFQNESVQKPVTEHYEKSKQSSNEKDLDRAIIVEEQESDSISIKEDQNDNIFGSFK